MDEKNHINPYLTIGIILAIIAIMYLIVVCFNAIKPQPVTDSSLMPLAASSPAVSLTPVDQSKLADDYKVASDKILAEYLSAAANEPSRLADLSDNAKNSLLALTLPAEFKANHLSEVLLLSEISESVRNGKTSEAQAKFSELKAFINK